MIGKVDTAGRSLLGVELRPDTSRSAVTIDVWIDTGFTGDLVLPQSVIDGLRLPKSGSVAILGSGLQVELFTYTCAIECFGSVRKLEVIANDGDQPLLGVGLLRGKELCIDYQNLKLSLTEIA